MSNKNKKGSVAMSWHSSLSVLLRYNWHAALCKFKVYSILIYISSEMITQWVLLTSIISYRYKKKKFSLIMTTFRIYSLSNFKIYHKIVLTMFFMFHITFPVLIYLITGGLYLLTTFIQFLSVNPLFSDFQKLLLCSLLLVAFKVSVR